MAWFDVNGTRLFGQDTGGAGEVIVFSHGLLFNHRMYDAQVQALQGRFRCVAYDHRGQGQSAPGEGHQVSTEQTYQDAVALIESLGVGAVHFVGLSMGGFVGLRLAARRPDLVKKLVVLESSADREPEENIFKYRLLANLARVVGVPPLLGRVMPIMFGRTFLSDPARAEERERWGEELCRNTKDIYRATNGVIERETVLPELKRITAPTLILVGEEDVATVPEKSRRMQGAIAGSKFQLVPQAGHSSTVENPGFITAQLEQFFST
jgi:pimeloyl-ACP methyl ester carboxylesterase